MMCALKVEHERLTTLADGTLVRIRPICTGDESAMVAFHETLSDHTIYMRYFHLMALPFRVNHERLAKVCTFDPHSQLVFVAEVGARIVAVGRIAREADADQAEFAILIADAYQNKGLGHRLLNHLIDVARWSGISLLTADVLGDNYAMIHLCQKAGFELQRNLDDGTVSATKRLTT